MKKIKELIIGIDPGASGAIATYSNGTIRAVKMPKEVRDIKSFLELQTAPFSKVMVYIEKVQTYRGKKNENLKDEFMDLFMIHKDPNVLFDKYEEFREGADDAPGKKFGINKMLANYTALLTVIKLLDIPFIEVYPISWQTTLNLRMKGEKITKTERKNRYKTFSQNCFPELKVNLATSDALCLVQFALTKKMFDPRWIEDRTVKPSVKNLFE
tara:strand:- start:40668 stop:41306 length:639 start_codon:yes stop_codon:yes gene_type:complete